MTERNLTHWNHLHTASAHALRPAAVTLSLDSSLDRSLDGSAEMAAHGIAAHSIAAWVRPARALRPSADALRQPQDGARIADPLGVGSSRTAPAKAVRRTFVGIGVALAAVLTGGDGARPGEALQPEPEDACLTGGTRSLSRRVLGLNVIAPAAQPASLRQPVPQQAATIQTDLLKPGPVAKQSFVVNPASAHEAQHTHIA